jgi:hypothetical protein
MAQGGPDLTPRDRCPRLTQSRRAMCQVATGASLTRQSLSRGRGNRAGGTGSVFPAFQKNIRMSRPIVPEDVARRQGHPLWRAAAATVRGFIDRVSAERAAKEMFDDDKPTAELLKRAASGPATIGNAGWAGTIAQLAVRDAIQSVSSISAGAALLTGYGLQVDLTGYASIRIPGRLLRAQDAGGWTGEGKPLQVRNLSMTSGPTLAPRKLGVIVVFSREIAESSLLPEITKQTMGEALGLALDAALLSGNADDGITPGGLLAGATIVATGSGMGQDLGALVGALASAGGGLAPVFIAAAKQAVAMKALLGPKWDYPILASSTLADGTVVAIESSSLVSTIGETPSFETSTGVTLHMEDTTPQDITGGTPSPAVPAISTYQRDLVALKMIFASDFGMRAAGHVAVVTGASW